MKLIEKDGNKIAAVLSVASALAAGYSVHTMFSALHPVALAQDNQDDALAKEVSDSYYIEEAETASVPEVWNLSQTNSIPEQSAEDVNVVESNLEAAADASPLEMAAPVEMAAPAENQEAPAPEENTVLVEAYIVEQPVVFEQTPEAVDTAAQQAPVEDAAEFAETPAEAVDAAAQPTPVEGLTESIETPVEAAAADAEVEQAPAEVPVEQEAPVELPPVDVVEEAPAVVEETPAVVEEAPIPYENDGPTAEELPDPNGEIPILEEVPTVETAEDPTVTPVVPAPDQVPVEDQIELPPVEPAPAPVDPVEPAPAPVDPVEPAPAPVAPVEPAPAPVDPVEVPDTQAPEEQYDQYSDLNARIADEALKLVGVTDGWQCTEVVQAALANAGVQDAASLWPREYEAMFGSATSNPQPGNLIYYNQGGDGLDHIAVYVGDGQAVHGNYITDGVSQTVIANAELPGCTDYTYIQVER